MNFKLITKTAITRLVDMDKCNLVLHESDVSMTAGKKDDGHACINIDFCGDKVYHVILDAAAVDALIAVLVEIAQEGEVLQ